MLVLGQIPKIPTSCRYGGPLHTKESIMVLAAFMATALGRLIRVVAGIVLVVVGVTVMGSTVGWILAAVGAVLIALGAFNYCVISLLVGAPFSGGEALERQKRASS
jgi:hypothetical protein